MADDAMDLLNNEPIARKKLTIFFIIDTSGSMNGARIGSNCLIDVPAGSPPLHAGDPVTAWLM